MNQLSARGTMAASCMIFFALGVITGALGLALPDLAANVSSSLATIGAIFTALFLGGFIMQLIAGSLNDRLGQRPVLLLGIGLLAAGICGIAASHALALTLACALVAGLGHGAVAVSTSVLIAQVFAARSASALNLINVFFGVGAVAGPAIAGLTLRVWGSALPALGLGAGLILLQAPFVRRLASAPSVAQLDDPAAPSGAPLRSPPQHAAAANGIVVRGENRASRFVPHRSDRGSPSRPRANASRSSAERCDYGRVPEGTHPQFAES